MKEPQAYRDCVHDCDKFRLLFEDARKSLELDHLTAVFDLSTVFLSVRNIATCFSLGVTNIPDFSRHSAKRLPLQDRLALSQVAYSTIERARILTTRGTGEPICESEVKQVVSQMDIISNWMNHLVERAKSNG